jgi:dATP pyrophosphohydrolase
MNQPLRELPVRPYGVCAYIVRRVEAGDEYLLLKRAPHEEIPNLWQPVAGGIHSGETAWQAAVREVGEETGLRIAKLYSANIIQSFYSAPDDCIVHFPVFVAFVSADQPVTISAEHSEYQWLDVDQAELLLTFRQHVTALREIDAWFVRRPPSEHLRIPILGKGPT